MYFPYLRGRQYELIAIRELVENNLIGKEIIPIIEPVKPTSTLVKTIDLFLQKERDLAFIHNPQVGSYEIELLSLKETQLKNKLLNITKEEFILPMHIMNKDSLIDIKKITDLGTNKEDMIVLINNSDDLQLFTEIWKESMPRFILISDNSEFRRAFSKNKVLCADHFPKEERNADYLSHVDRPFSTDHLFFSKENYEGFSDFSIVGNHFSESGFAPNAVIIHIVYFDSDNKLRIRHFGSDSNDDFYDPAGKFYEALTKLMDWKNESYNGSETFALKVFEEHFNAGTYPGLGTIKKLSIMHHLELMSHFLINRGT